MKNAIKWFLVVMFIALALRIDQVKAARWDVPQGTVTEAVQSASDCTGLSQYRSLTKKDIKVLQKQYGVVPETPKATAVKVEKVLKDIKVKKPEEVNEEIQTEETHENEPIHPAESDDFVPVPYIQTMGTVAETDVKALYRAVTNYPDQEMIRKFIADGGIFYMTGDPEMLALIRQYDLDKSTTGVYVYDRPTPAIFFAKEVELGTVIIHEMGHYLEYRLGYVADLDVFMAIYREEAGNSGIAPLYTGINYEYFAEAYRQYVMDPAFRDRAPKTYDYIVGCMDAFHRL